jgi:N4-gp56 family major capsid protein
MAGQLWVTNSLGGYMYADQLSEVMRLSVQPLVKFRQFCDGKDATEKGLHKGQLFHWDVYSDIATQGGVLVETTTMPESNFTITQGTLTITEQGNSIPYSGKLDNLSKQPITEAINKVLKHDAKKAFDIAAHTQFDATPLRVVGGTAGSISLTTNGTATATNSIALGAAHVKTIVDTMKERNVPPYSMDDYFCMAHPTTLRTFKNDLEDIHKYVGEGLQMIMNGEVGRYESTRFVEQTFIPKGGAADSGTFNPATNTGDPWDNALSSWAFFFGEDTCAEAMAIPEEIRGKIPGDYGRSKGVAWYYLGKQNCPVAAQAANDNCVNSGELLAA